MMSIPMIDESTTYDFTNLVNNNYMCNSNSHGQEKNELLAGNYNYLMRILYEKKNRTSNY